MMKILELYEKGTVYTYYFNGDKKSFTISYTRNDEVVHKEFVKLAEFRGENIIRTYHLFTEFAEEIWLNIPNKWKVTFMRNFLIYSLSKLNNVPVYRTISDILVIINGKRKPVTLNSIAKNIYKNANVYEDILKTLLQKDSRITA